MPKGVSYEKLQEDEKGTKTAKKKEYDKEVAADLYNRVYSKLLGSRPWGGSDWGELADFLKSLT